MSHDETIESDGARNRCARSPDARGHHGTSRITVAPGCATDQCDANCKAYARLPPKLWLPPAWASVALPQVRQSVAYPAQVRKRLNMIKYLLLALATLSDTAAAQVMQPGDWDVTSKVVDITVPGVPGFLVRMMKGKSKAERKRLSSGQGIETLLAPDPKAQCRIDSQHVVGGRYTQTLSCPQKKGDWMRINRTGTYDATGFTGRATVNGTTPKGILNIVLDQRASYVGRVAR